MNLRKKVLLKYALVVIVVAILSLVVRKHIKDKYLGSNDVNYDFTNPKRSK